MSTIDPRALRSAFGSFMTGVTVVTTRSADGAPVGFTANSFSSVSLDPPMLLVCPGKFLSSYDAFAACSHFAVNVLAEGQEEVSNTFASYKGDRFSRVSHFPDKHGVPLIKDAIAQFSCATQQVVPAGDHCILMGKVRGLSHAGGRGLGYVGGQYFSLGLERAALENTDGRVVCGTIIGHDNKVLLEKTPKGYRPPQIVRQDRVSLRKEISNDLAARGLDAQLGPAYSVFDDAGSRTHFVYFLATGTLGAPGGNLHSIPIGQLPTLTYSNAAIAEMMARYAVEARTRSFALYLGDSRRGDTHSLSEGT